MTQPSIQMKLYDPAELFTIISQLKTGEQFVYFKGNLARALGGRSGKFDTQAKVRALRDFMLLITLPGEFSFGSIDACGKIDRGKGEGQEERDSYSFGGCLGHLTQRRIKEGIYEYIFTKGKPLMMNVEKIKIKQQEEIEKKAA